MTGDQNALRAAVLAAPTDPAPKLVYADWVQGWHRHDWNYGQVHDLAFGLRWCAARGKHPRWLKSLKVWNWQVVGTNQALAKPHNLSSFILGSWLEWDRRRYHQDFDEAIRCIGNILRFYWEESKPS